MIQNFPEGDYYFIVNTLSGGCELQVLILEQNADASDMIRFSLCSARAF